MGRLYSDGKIDMLELHYCMLHGISYDYILARGR